MALFIPSDGRLTEQNILTGKLAGSEVMYIVSPGTTAAGNSYQIPLTTLAPFFSAFPYLNTEVITAGATYNVLNTDTRILVNKTLGSATSIVFPSAISMLYPVGVLVKDIKGDASTNPITITFSGGQLCDGLSSIQINSNYGYMTINPVPSGSGWYLTA